MKSPENVVFAAVEVLLDADEKAIVWNRWGLAGLAPCEDINAVAARLGVSRLLAIRKYARAIVKLRTSDVTRRAFDAFEQRRAA